MTEQEALQIFGQAEAVITDSHIVYTTGLHGNAYVNKDAIYPHVQLTSHLCWAIAQHFTGKAIDVVVAPAIGGVILCTWTAHWLELLTGRPALALYAEKTDDGEKFAFNRGYGKLVIGKRVLVVEDVLTTGGSAKKVIEATRALGGNVIGLGVLCNRGEVTPQTLADVPELFALVNLKLDTWDAADCPLCKQNVPINTDVGKGRDFLARQARENVGC